MTDAYSPRLDEALRFAAAEFRQKVRKGSGVPYLTHLLSVAALVGEGGGDEDQIIAAVLHDWLEDIPSANAERLTEMFGERVCRIVQACSDCEGEPKPPWRQRKESYIAHLRDADADIKLVSCADKLHNCRSTVTDLRLHGVRVFERFNAKQAGTLWYYQALIPALASQGWEHFLLDHLRVEVAELVRLGSV